MERGQEQLNLFSSDISIAAEDYAHMHEQDFQRGSCRHDVPWPFDKVVKTFIAGADNCPADWTFEMIEKDNPLPRAVEYVQQTYGLDQYSGWGKFQIYEALCNAYCSGFLFVAHQRFIVEQLNNK